MCELKMLLYESAKISSVAEAMRDALRNVRTMQTTEPIKALIDYISLHFKVITEFISRF